MLMLKATIIIKHMCKVATAGSRVSSYLISNCSSAICSSAILVCAI